jgi:GAF domain-containing protein
METRTSSQPSDTEFTRPPRKRLADYLGFLALAVPAAGAILLGGYLLLFVLAVSTDSLRIPYYLLVAASGALGLVLLVMPTGKMLQNDDISRPMLRNGLGAGLFFLCLNLAWAGFTLISIVGVWLPLILFYFVIEDRRQAIRLAGIAGTFTALILLTSQYRPIDPAIPVDPAAVPASALTIFVIVSVLTVTVLTNLVKFRTVTRRLTVTFVAVTLFPALATVLIATLQAYLYSQSLFLGAVESMATQRAGNIAIVGLLAIMLSLLAIVLTSRTITTPIKELADSARQVSEGRLSTRADAGRPDELGALAESFNFMAATLQGIVNNLEASIAERTRDLQRQALRLRAAAEISRDSAGAISVKDLLARSADLISERFGFYHVSIFVLDGNREYLILNAASGEIGKLMLETGFRVRGGEGVVGSVAQTGSSRMISDMSREPAPVRSPMLPGTRSELGLPLKSYNVLIGVLDVHSDQANAFADEDVAALQLMADQLSVAIERTRIIQESESSLRELERSYQRYTRESWQALTRDRESGVLGYRYEGANFQPLMNVPAPIRESLERGETVVLPGMNGASAGNSLAVPIKLRGSTIGAISLKVHSAEVPQETTDLARDISERLAQALEASWLLNESRTRAERERFIAEISAKIGAAPDVENILRTTVEELGTLVGNSQITIKLKSGPSGPAHG